MADLTLALDIGSQSIGWALVDPLGKRIVGTGVRVFPEGVDRDTKGSELSKNETRRVVRGMRRQVRRRAMRKQKLRALLASHGLLPTDSKEQASLLQSTDPYLLRARALDEKLTPHEIGRVIQQLNQRRGFLSNKKADKAKKSEDSKMLASISALQAEIEAANCRTLGEFMARKVAKPGEVPLIRVRGKHTRRKMFEAEFDLVWEAQQKHHPKLLTDTLKEKIRGVLFFQRAMYWPASVIGKCELCPRLPRAPRADRRVQLFRILQEVNNTRILDTASGEERALVPEERERLIALLSAKDKMKFDDIRKKMHFLESVRFNLEKGDRKELKGLATDKLFRDKKVLGKLWDTFADEQKNRLVFAVIDGDENKIAKVARDLEIPEPCIEPVQSLNLEEGYASYSLNAIKKLLPFMRAGLPLTSRDNENALVKAGFQRPWDHEAQKLPLLPNPPAVANPLVQAALFEVRKVVNAIVRDLVNAGGHKLSAIHLEMTREVRGSAEQRARQSREMRETEARRNNIADELRELGEKPTREKMLRYQLWLEQGKHCVYSGDFISLHQLLSGEVDVDHILPYSRSLDDSMMNKVVCFRSTNGLKGNRTPHEWLSGDPEKFDKVLQRAKKLAYPKHYRFRITELQQDEFINRQLSDTSYITSLVHHYLKVFGVDVVCTKGQCTAPLRRMWGMNSILNDGDLKTREDHRHHAVDALVIALTDRSRLKKLAELRRFGFEPESGEPGSAFPPPWEGFLEQSSKAISSIYVSHRPRRKVAGALHEETLYGKTANAEEFVVRKPVETLTLAMVNDVRDQKIRKLIRERLISLGVNVDDKKSPIPKEWSKGLVIPPRKPGGVAVPILRVRVIRKDKTITEIRPGAFVKPGSLHHACLFEYTDEKGKLKRDAVYVSMLEAIRRVKDKKPIISKVHPEIPEAKFLMSVSPGDMLLAVFKGKERLTTVTTLVSTQKRIHLIDANDARKSADREDEGKTPNSIQARKITVDPIGRIRWAND